MAPLAHTHTRHQPTPTTMTFDAIITMLHIAGYLLFNPRLCVAANNVNTLTLNKIPAFASTRSSLHLKSPNTIHAFELQAQSTREKKNPFSDLLKAVAQGKNSNQDIDSVQDFDVDLANEIQDALLSAGVGNIDDTESKSAETNKEVNGLSAENINKKVIRPPIENKAPRQNIPQLPPHTALAQVVANQYSIDLTEVSPSSPGNKITADDVEYHAWKISQPPCTPEALELAHSLGLNLNELYDDEDREYVMQLSDVELFQENARSLKMATQIKKGVDYGSISKSDRRKTKKINALDKRMEQNMGKLSQSAMKLAGTVTGGIMQQIKLQTQKIQLEASEKLKDKSILGDAIAKSTDTFTAVEDFDADLAREIEAALSSANGEGNKEETNRSSNEVVFDVNGSIKATEAEDSVSDIQEALLSVSVDNEDDEMANEDVSLVTKGEVNGSTQTAEEFNAGPVNGIEKVSADAKDECCEDSSMQEGTTSSSSTREKLLSMKCVQLKLELRQRGMKVSGKKVELVDRLIDVMEKENESDDDVDTDVDIDDRNKDLPFFAMGK